VKIALRNKPTKKQGKSLYLDFYDNGRRWYEFLNLFLTGDRRRDKETMRLADGILSQRRLDAAATQNGLPAPSRLKADFITYCRKLGESKTNENTRRIWKKAINHLARFAGNGGIITYCRKLGESKTNENTRRIWKKAINHLAHFAGNSGVTFAGVNDTLLENFKDYLLARFSQNTAGTYLSKIKAACRKAAKEQILTSHVGIYVTIKKQKTLPKYLTFEEIQQLQATPIMNQAVRDGFLFSCFSGLRYSDVKALTWDQVRFEDAQVFLWFSQQKTGEAEALPLSKQAIEILNAQKDSKPSPGIRRKFENNVIFKLPSTSQSVNDALGRWAKRAGIAKKVTFHCGRHSFATMALTYGADLYTTEKTKFPHENISRTMPPFFYTPGLTTSLKVAE